jgi:S-adenosylmethionine:tRNA ribosyltransferase-isomerase
MSVQSMQFEVPEALEAHLPPELRGVARDGIRLMVLPRFDGPVVHTRFHEIGDFLKPGDLLVVNSSRTLPATLNACDENGAPTEVRLANQRSEDRWDALLLRGRAQAGRAGMRLDFGSGMSGHVLARSPEHSFLWEVQFDRCCAELLDIIYRLGFPVRYSYAAEGLPLDLYQTVYADEPGSVEMPSAGRPFTWQLLLALQRKGIALARITLHTSLSSTRDESLDALHPIYEEEYNVPTEAAAAVLEARAKRGRVIAVGTTVVRALESAALAVDPGPAGADLEIKPGRARTSLHITAAHQLRVVDALLTGLHEPESSHLDLLSAFVRPERLRPAYLEAVARGYLWHEFGDVNLII